MQSPSAFTEELTWMLILATRGSLVRDVAGGCDACWFINDADTTGWDGLRAEEDDVTRSSDELLGDELLGDAEV